jgi:hypothetical protein
VKPGDLVKYKARPNEHYGVVVSLSGAIKYDRTFPVEVMWTADNGDTHIQFEKEDWLEVINEKG